MADNSLSLLSECIVADLLSCMRFMFAIFAGLILSGFATFAPKFVQNQFSTTASSASMIVGKLHVELSYLLLASLTKHAVFYIMSS